jgi:hypothetical protein
MSAAAPQWRWFQRGTHSAVFARFGVRGISKRQIFYCILHFPIE